MVLCPISAGATWLAQLVRLTTEEHFTSPYWNTVRLQQWHSEQKESNAAECFEPIRNLSRSARKSLPFQILPNKENLSAVWWDATVYSPPKREILYLYPLLPKKRHTVRVSKHKYCTVLPFSGKYCTNGAVPLVQYMEFTKRWQQIHFCERRRQCTYWRRLPMRTPPAADWLFKLGQHGLPGLERLKKISTKKVPFHTAQL